MAAAHSRHGSKTNSQNVLRPHQRQTPDTTFADLPEELRLKIWSCAVEPRLVILDDLVEQEKSYPLPSVTQLSVTARAETRQGYEAVGRGSYFDFSRDIMVCDVSISDRTSSPPWEDLALRVRRLAFWDCLPDDDRVDGLSQYSAYLDAFHPRSQRGSIEFDKVWFPNLTDLWIIKIGEVHPSWMVGLTDPSMPYEVRMQKSARQFRYWVDQDVVETAPLDLNDAETKMILREGRCGISENCQKLNLGRPRIVSKIIFKDGKYNDDPEPGGRHIAWKRIRPWPTSPDQASAETDADPDRMRWIMVERVLTFSLRWDEADEEDDGEAPQHRRTRRGPETE